MGSPSSIDPGLKLAGNFKVPSYRTGLFLDPKGRGTTTGYDQAIALPALQAGGDESLFNENNKKFEGAQGAAAQGQLVRHRPVDTFRHPFGPIVTRMSFGEVGIRAQSVCA